MDLSRYVNHLGSELAALAEAGGEESRALIERLAGSVESAIRMTLLDALSAAADEISRELAPGSVQLQLRGRDPSFVVALPPAEPLAPRESREADEARVAPDADPLLAEDGPAVRINVRMPETLKAAIETAADQEGRSVNAWLIRMAAAALRQSAPNAGPAPSGAGKRGKQRLTGWVR